MKANISVTLDEEFLTSDNTKIIKKELSKKCDKIFDRYSIKVRKKKKPEPEIKNEEEIVSTAEPETIFLASPVMLDEEEPQTRPNQKKTILTFIVLLCLVLGLLFIPYFLIKKQKEEELKPQITVDKVIEEEKKEPETEPTVDFRFGWFNDLSAPRNVPEEDTTRIPENIEKKKKKIIRKKPNITVETPTEKYIPGRNPWIKDLVDPNQLESNNLKARTVPDGFGNMVNDYYEIDWLKEFIERLDKLSKFQ